MNAFSIDPYLYDLTSQLDPPDLTVWIKGELDFSTDDGLGSFSDSDLEDVHKIVVDLADLVFIDVAGVRMLRAWHDTQTESQRVVSMVSARRSVRRLFQLLDSEEYLAAA